MPRRYRLCALGTRETPVQALAMLGELPFARVFTEPHQQGNIRGVQMPGRPREAPIELSSAVKDIEVMEPELVILQAFERQEVSDLGAVLLRAVLVDNQQEEGTGVATAQPLVRIHDLSDRRADEPLRTPLDSHVSKKPGNLNPRLN